MTVTAMKKRKPKLRRKPAPGSGRRKRRKVHPVCGEAAILAIQKAMEKHKISARALAAHLAVDGAQLSRWLSGKNVPTRFHVIDRIVKGIAQLDDPETLKKAKHQKPAGRKPRANKSERQIFSAGLRHIIETENLYQADIARFVGVSPVTMYNWVTGRTAPPENERQAIYRTIEKGLRELRKQEADEGK